MLWILFILYDIYKSKYTHIYIYLYTVYIYITYIMYIHKAISKNNYYYTLVGHLYVFLGEMSI